MVLHLDTLFEVQKSKVIMLPVRIVFVIVLIGEHELLSKGSLTVASNVGSFCSFSLTFLTKEEIN
jgi:hypothetical protein